MLLDLDFSKEKWFQNDLIFSWSKKITLNLLIWRLCNNYWDGRDRGLYQHSSCNSEFKTLWLGFFGWPLRVSNVLCSPLCSSTNLLLCRGFFLYYNNVRACMYGKNSCLVLTKQIAFLLFEADVKILITLIIGIWKRIRVSIVNIAFCKLQRHFVNYKETYLFNFVWI